MDVLLRLDELEEGAAKGLDGGLFAVKKDGRLFAYENRCPHLGTPLEWEEDRFLDADGALIQCSTHGALFTIEEGYCVAGPCRGKSLRAASCVVKDGVARIRMRPS